MPAEIRPILAHDTSVLRQASELFGASRREAMPWLPDLHSADEDYEFFRTRVVVEAQLHGAFVSGELLGIIAFNEEWVWHLYIKPGHQGKGLGSQLLDLVYDVPGPKKLFVFQDNERACRFYESKGFMAVAFGDGAGNEEKLPDVLYLWGRAEG